MRVREICQGTRRRGRPNIWWNDACKRNITKGDDKGPNINESEWRKKLVSYTGDPR